MEGDLVQSASDSTKIGMSLSHSNSYPSLFEKRGILKGVLVVVSPAEGLLGPEVPEVSSCP